MELVFRKLDKERLDYELKKPVRSFFTNYVGIFLNDGYNGTTDGLVKFSVEYNSVWYQYRFCLIGGTRYEEKTAKLRQWFIDHGYSVDEPQGTWVWQQQGEGKPAVYVPGLQFWVAAKD